jgi:hypothetical protein
VSTRTITYVFCDRCNQQQSFRTRGMAVCMGHVAKQLRRMGWRRYWDGKTRRSKRPIECDACIADGKANPAPMFAAGGAS